MQHNITREKNIKKNLIAACGALCGIFLATSAGVAEQTITVQASDYEYYGQLDSFTGERIMDSGEVSGTEATSNSVWLSDAMYYDLEQRLFRYPTGIADVYSNVADGMVVTDHVVIRVQDGVPLIVFKDGELMDYFGGEIADAGNYTVQLADASQNARVFSFTIVSPRTGQIANYSMPDGFRITSAKRDGTEIDWSRNFVDLSQEGSYVVEYECYQTQIPYTLNVVIDTTPPQLVLEGVDEDGKARGPVTITGKEEYDTLHITKDGQVYTMLMTYTLTQSGRYVVTAVDEAGNISTYPFTIMIYLDRNGLVFVFIFAAILLGIVVYIHYHRTHLKVR